MSSTLASQPTPTASNPPTDPVVNATITDGTPDAAVNPTTSPVAYNLVETIFSAQPDSDDVTVTGDNVSVKHWTVRAGFFISVDAETKVNKADALIKKAKEFLASLAHDMPSLSILPWDVDDFFPGCTQRQFLPTDTAAAEKFLWNFSRAQSSSTGYYRVFLRFEETDLITTISEFNDKVRIPKQQGISVAASNAKKPIIVGCLIGATSAFAESKVVQEVVKRIFKFQSVGFKYQVIGGVKGVDDKISWKDKQMVQLELDRADATPVNMKRLHRFFNTSKRATPLFGAKIVFFDLLLGGWRASAQLSTKLAKAVTAHSRISKDLQFYTTDEYVLSKTIPKIDKTLLQALCELESIHEKQVHGGDAIRGRLFHSIVPMDKDVYTFQFFKVNSTEALAVIRALCLFVRDHFKLKPEGFCQSRVIEDANLGTWNFEKRTYLTQDDLDFDDQLGSMVEFIVDENPPFSNVPISKELRSAFAAPDDDASTVATDLRNKEMEDLSLLTTSTSTSKVKKVSEALRSEFLNVMSAREDEFTRLKAQQDEEMSRLRILLESATTTPHSRMSKEKPDEVNSPPRTGSTLTDCVTPTPHKKRIHPTEADFGISLAIWDRITGEMSRLEKQTALDKIDIDFITALELYVTKCNTYVILQQHFPCVVSWMKNNFYKDFPSLVQKRLDALGFHKFTVVEHMDIDDASPDKREHAALTPNSHGRTAKRTQSSALNGSQNED